MRTRMWTRFIPRTQEGRIAELLSHLLLELSVCPRDAAMAL